MGAAYSASQTTTAPPDPDAEPSEVRRYKEHRQEFVARSMTQFERALLRCIDEQVDKGAPHADCWTEWRTLGEDLEDKSAVDVVKRVQRHYACRGFVVRPRFNMWRWLIEAEQGVAAADNP